MYLTSEALNQKTFKHGFFGRNGGVSKNIFASLNCSLNDYDQSENVIANRKIVAQKMGYELASLKLVKQIHSNKAVVVDKNNLNHIHEADAIITNTPGILIGVQTADCCPVLFLDPKAKVIGAAHAGWRGALNGILQSTVSSMQALGSNKENLIAVLGPSISQESYEVDAVFKKTFISQTNHNEKYFIQGFKEDKFMFNLKEYCLDILRDLKISLVEDMSVDTYSSEKDFFSFRRATHQGHPKTGGQLSVISIE